MVLSKLGTVSSPIPKESKKVPAYLDDFAEFIFQKLVLKNDGDTFRFCEVEFYIHSTSHLDIFTHQAYQQTQFGLWYFHESGLDITFGDGDTHASFLIRGIRKEESIKEERYTSGPLKVMKALFNSSQKIDAGQINIRVEYSDNLPSTRWIKHERIGLNKQKEVDQRTFLYGDADSELFYNKHYRYISWLEPDHRFPNRTNSLKYALEFGEDRQMIRDAFSYTPGFLK